MIAEPKILQFDYNTNDENDLPKTMALVKDLYA